jgi:hypothetical protein
VIGALGTPQDGALVTRLAVSVPPTGTSRLVVGTGPVTDANGATWTVQAVSATGTQQVRTSTTMSTGTAWTPVDMSVFLNAWKGQTVQVTLSFSERSGAPQEAAPLFVEPRVLTTAP